MDFSDSENLFPRQGIQFPNQGNLFPRQENDFPGQEMTSPHEKNHQKWLENDVFSKNGRNPRAISSVTPSVKEMPNVDFAT